MTDANNKTEPENTDKVIKSDSEDKQAGKQQKVDFTKRLTKIILITASLYFLWYIIGDRHTPITDQARVRGFVIPIVPQISGQISRIHIGGDKKVKKDDLLFEIDARDYELALEQAKYDLKLAGQTVGADTASVASAKAQLAMRLLLLCYWWELPLFQ
jgi:multidrug resistance efflux pump